MALLSLPSVAAAAGDQRSEFFWLGEINKASIVINTDEGLLDPALAPRIAAGLSQVLANGEKPGGKQPRTVISFEPLLIEAAGVEATLIHAGRSSQDMHATFRAAILRHELLQLAEQVDSTRAALIELAARHVDTIVPNYTNGVAAQANSYGHQLLGYEAGLERDAQRIREAYARMDRSPMGTTVLNGTRWPLNRERMASYLGFSQIVENAYDAGQISSVDLPVEVGAIVQAIALHTGAFVEDVMVQYAQPRPWILLAEGKGNTYVSSAMPQKRNPGLLNNTRTHASEALNLGMGAAIKAHNIPPGMVDAKDVHTNSTMVDSGIRVLAEWERILKGLVIDPQRALEALDSDWTASQELADVLMRNYQVPFRVGHHFASEVVDYAREHDIRPSQFPYEQAQRIYVQAGRDHQYDTGALPMSETEFRTALDPVQIVRNRATSGGPQPDEMKRMLDAARQRLAQSEAQIEERKTAITSALARLDADFQKIR